MLFGWYTSTGSRGTLSLAVPFSQQPSLSSGLSDAPWLNRRRPGSLYSPPPPPPPGVLLPGPYQLTYCIFKVRRLSWCTGMFAFHRLSTRVIVCVLLLQDLLQNCSRGGGGPGGEWRTCAMRDDESRPVWISLPITHWDPWGTRTWAAVIFLNNFLGPVGDCGSAKYPLLSLKS